MSLRNGSARIRVRYAETDQMGVAYYANYFVWMEVGRVELMKHLGLRYRDLEQQGYLLAVAEAGCRYMRPARYDEELVVETTLEEANPRLVRFGYRILEGSSGALLARGFTKHVVCDRSLRPVRLPEEYLSKLKAGLCAESLERQPAG